MYKNLLSHFLLPLVILGCCMQAHAQKQLEVTYEQNDTLQSSFTGKVTFLRHGQSERYAWKPSSSPASHYNSLGKAFDISRVKSISRNVEYTSRLTLPAQSSVKLSDVVVVGDKDEVTIDEKGQYKTESDYLSAMTADGKPLYSCWASADSTGRTNKADLNAMETAVKCLLELFPLAADQTADKDFQHLKDMVRDIDETRRLAEAIDASIVKNGFFNRKDVEPQLETAVRKMISLLGWDNLAAANSRIARSPVPPTGLKYDGGGMTVTVDESRWVKMSTFDFGWRCKLTASNYSRYGYTAIVKGEFKENGELYIPDYNVFHYIVKPQRVTSSFFDHFEFWEIDNWDKVGDFYSQSYQFMTHQIEIDEMTWDKEITDNISIDFESSNDVVVALGPDKHQNVYFYNIIQLFAKPILKKVQSFVKDEIFEGGYEWDITEHFINKMLLDASFMSSINFILIDTEYSRFEKKSLIANKVLGKFKDLLFEELEGIGQNVLFLAFKVTAKDKKRIENDFEDAFWHLELVKKFGDFFLGMLGLMEGDVIYRMNFDFTDPGLVIPGVPGYDL